MHEMSTCQSIIRQLEKIALEHKEKNVSHIVLSVGDLARVDIAELQQLFPIAAKDTIANNAKLTIKNEPIGIYCPACEKHSNVSAADLSCPACSHLDTQLESGTEMNIAEVSF